MEYWHIILLSDFDLAAKAYFYREKINRVMYIDFLASKRGIWKWGTISRFIASWVAIL